MAILATQTIVGSVGRVYDLRTVGRDNIEVVDFTVAVTPRKKSGDEWVDGTTYWITVTAWGKLAKNISESFRAGDRVFVYGRTEMKEGYQNNDGKDIPARPIVIAEFAGLELAFHPAHSDKPERGEGNSRRNDSGSNSNRNRRDEDDAPAKTSNKKVVDDDDDLGFDDSEFTPF